MPESCNHASIASNRSIGASVAFLCALHQKLPPVAVSYSARGRNNEGSGDDPGTIAAAISDRQAAPLRPATPRLGGIDDPQPTCDCLWTGTSRMPWRMRTSPAATVTATRSPISRHGTE